MHTSCLCLCSFFVVVVGEEIADAAVDSLEAVVEPRVVAPKHLRFLREAEYDRHHRALHHLQYLHHDRAAGLEQLRFHVRSVSTGRHMCVGPSAAATYTERQRAGQEVVVSLENMGDGQPHDQGKGARYDGGERQDASCGRMGLETPENVKSERGGPAPMMLSLRMLMLPRAERRRQVSLAATQYGLW